MTPQEYYPYPPPPAYTPAPPQAPREEEIDWKFLAALIAVMVVAGLIILGIPDIGILIPGYTKGFKYTANLKVFLVDEAGNEYEYPLKASWLFWWQPGIKASFTGFKLKGTMDVEWSGVKEGTDAVIEYSFKEMGLVPSISVISPGSSKTSVSPYKGLVLVLLNGSTSITATVRDVITDETTTIVITYVGDDESYAYYKIETKQPCLIAISSTSNTWMLDLIRVNKGNPVAVYYGGTYEHEEEVGSGEFRQTLEKSSGKATWSFETVKVTAPRLDFHAGWILENGVGNAESIVHEVARIYDCNLVDVEHNFNFTMGGSFTASDGSTRSIEGNYATMLITCTYAPYSAFNIGSTEPVFLRIVKITIGESELMSFVVFGVTLTPGQMSAIVIGVIAGVGAIAYAWRKGLLRRLEYSWRMRRWRRIAYPR